MYTHALTVFDAHTNDHMYSREILCNMYVYTYRHDSTQHNYAFNVYVHVHGVNMLVGFLQLNRDMDPMSLQSLYSK